MKKVISLICVMVMLVLCVAGCGKKENKPTIYETINNLIDKEYSVVNLSVKTTMGNETLKGTYTINKENNFTLIEYSYEMLNGFSEVGGVIIPPTEEKSTISGSMKVKDSKVIEQNGESVNIPVEQLSINGLTFDESFFTDIQDSDGLFSAKVSKVKDFLGFELNCTDMKITVNYTTDKISKVNIQYISESSSNIEIQYSIIN